MVPDALTIALAIAPELWREHLKQLAWTPHLNVQLACLGSISPSDFVTSVCTVPTLVTYLVVIVSLLYFNSGSLCCLILTRLEELASLGCSRHVVSQAVQEAAPTESVEQQSALVESAMVQKAAESILNRYGAITLAKPVSLNLDVTGSDWNPMSIALCLAVWTDHKPEMAIALSRFTWSAKRGD